MTGVVQDWLPNVASGSDDDDDGTQITSEFPSPASARHVQLAASEEAIPESSTEV